MSQVKILLNENDIPKQWYNVVAEPAVPCPAPGTDARYPGKDLLQERGRESGWFTQTH